MRSRPILAERDLLLLVSASFVSVLGDAAALIALTLRLHAGGSGGWAIAALLLAGTAPLVLLSPVAGVVADRWDSRVVIVGAAMAQAACAFALAQVTSRPATLALVALLGAATSLVGPAVGALVPYTVPADRLVNAGAAMQTAFVVGELAGPGVGGALTGAWGARAPLELDAVSFLVIAVGICFVRTRRRPDQHTADSGDRLAGARLLLGDPLLRTVIASMTLLVLVAGAVNVAEVFLFKDALHTSDAVFGLASACWMAGMVAGSALMPRFGRETSRLLRAMALAELVMSLGLISAGVSPLWPVAAAAFVVGGVGNGILTVACRTIVVTQVPERLRGRAFGVMSATISAASVTAFGAGGALVSTLGPRTTVTGCGLAALSVGIGFALSVRRGAVVQRRPDTVPA